MADTLMIERPNPDYDGFDVIHSFAERVLDVLGARSKRTTALLREDLVLALAGGVVTQDEDVINRTLAEFRRACISPAAMIDLYIPEAARLLGSQWACDTMGFAEVTIATARLQAMVRAICTRWGGEFPAVSGRRSVLMVVPKGEDHTLGAIVATGQLRRMGVSVCLRLRPSPGEVAELMRTRTFNVAMISIAQVGRLDDCQRMVATMRKFGAPAMPLIVGGAAILAADDVAARIGACHASGDAAGALGFCGLTPGPDSLPARTGLRMQLRE